MVRVRVSPGHRVVCLVLQVMRDVANCIHNITSRIAVLDRKRKLEMAGRLQLRWQRWEMTNYDYLMQVALFFVLWQHAT